MALADCIARAGNDLSADDRTFLETRLSDGATDEDALNSLQESVTASITAVAERVQEVEEAACPFTTIRNIERWGVRFIHVFDPTWERICEDEEDE